MGRRRTIKKLRGPMRMNQLGYKTIQIWVTAKEHALIKKAANNDMRSCARFLVCAALRRVEEQKQADREWMKKKRHAK